MADRSLKIFLSYAFDDNAKVKKLYDQLLSLGTTPWLDTVDLLPGQDWKLEISKALDAADIILLCLTKKSVNKEGYVQKEMRLALDRELEMPEGKIFLIPARLEECDIPFSLRSYQWVDLFSADGMKRLVKSLDLRARQVGARPLSPGNPSSSPDKATKEKSGHKKKEVPPVSGTTININGNVTGSNIIIGDDNKINSDE